jgi:hypothetical protein
MAANVVYEGTAPNYDDKYLTTSTASKYEQDSGNHIWSTAASGTINTTIPWSERMRIDGTTGAATFSGSVDIYKTTDSQLQIKSLNEDATLIINSGADGVGGANREEGFIKFYQDNADFFTLGKRNNGQFVLTDHTASQDVITFQDGGGILIQPANNLTTFSGVVNIPVGAEATPSLIFAGDSDSGMWHPAANTLAFSTFGNERLRISSGGDATFTPSGGSVVIGSSGHITSTQALDAATAGGRFIGSSNGVLGDIRIEQTTTGADGGYIRFMTSPSGSTSPTEKMRITSGGDILLSSTEGKIGIKDSNSIYIGNFEGNNVGLRFIGVTNDIRPCTSIGDNQTDTIDLGDANARFKDFYLSGGVYLGGTSTVNKLDAYEEGSWTPVVNFGGTASSMAPTYNNGKFTRFGDLVTLTAYIVIGTINGTGAATLTGMPFPNGSGFGNLTSATLPHLGGINLGSYYTLGVNAAIASSTLAFILTSATTTAGATNSNFSNGSTIMFNFTYKAS